jgi:DNA ligase-1
MKLSELVTATGQVAATSSRLAKIDALATLLQSAEPDELAPVVGLLLAPRQGRLGVGWRGSPLSRSRPPRRRP